MLDCVDSAVCCNYAGDKTVEVAMTGTALPVLLDISPASKYDFGEVPVGEHADILCTLKNSSDVLPVTFQFRRIAHFIAHPPNGKIKPLDTQDIIFSFAPNQAGRFFHVQHFFVCVFSSCCFLVCEREEVPIK